MRGQGRKLVRADARRRVLDSDVGAIEELVWTLQLIMMRNLRGNTASGGLASDETLPGLGALADNIESVARECC